MKVIVKLYADLVRRTRETTLSFVKGVLKAGVPFEIELKEKSTVADLLDLLHLADKEPLIIFINGKNSGRDHGLGDGDQIGIFPPIGGG